MVSVQRCTTFTQKKCQLSGDQLPGYNCSSVSHQLFSKTIKVKDSVEVITKLLKKEKSMIEAQQRIQADYKMLLKQKKVKDILYEKIGIGLQSIYTRLH